MNQEVRLMLENVLDVFSEEFEDKTIAWERFLEFIATDSRGSLFYKFDHKFEWFFENIEFANSVIREYDHKLLTSDYYDHLGDLYIDKVAPKDSAKGLRARIVKSDLAEAIVNKSMSATEDRKKILIPYCATGRLLLASSRRAPKAVLFGVEPDINLYRIAYTNVAIHEIHAFLLHADPKSHQIDISRGDGALNWQLANEWNPRSEFLRPISKKVSVNNPN